MRDRAIALREVERLRGVADHLRGLGAGLQRAVVHDRLHRDERARRLPCGVGVDQPAPRERGRLAGQHVVDRRGAAREQLGHLGQLYLAGQQRLAEQRGQRRARPVRLGFFASSLTSGRARELRRRVRHFLRRQEQAVCSKNGPPPGSATWPMRPASDCFCSAPVSARGGRRELGRGRLDDREDRAVTLRERVVDRLTQRGPLRLGIDELADVRVDLEVLCHVHAAACGNDERQHDDQDGAAYRPCNESDDERCHHLAVGSGWQGQSNESIWRNVRSVVTMARKGREGYLLRIAGIGPAHRQLVSVCLIIGTPRRAMQRL
jgi:hypothetical protein